MKKNNKHHYLSYGHFSFVRNRTFRRNLYVVKDCAVRDTAGGAAKDAWRDHERARSGGKRPVPRHRSAECQDWRCARICVTLPA
jgi:hypothetical protein